MNRVFVDLDGVLVDFVNGISAAHKSPNPYNGDKHYNMYNIEEIWGITIDEFWRPTNHWKFWANLEPTKECFRLMEMLEDNFERDNIAILTSPSHNPDCVKGKHIWIKKHLPSFERRFLIGAPKHMCANDSSILIDDSDHKIKKFAKYGGHTFLWPQPWNIRFVDAKSETKIGMVKSYIDNLSFRSGRCVQDVSKKSS